MTSTTAATSRRSSSPTPPSSIPPSEGRRGGLRADRFSAAAGAPAGASTGARGRDGRLVALRRTRAALPAVIPWELGMVVAGWQPPVLAPLTTLLVTQVTVVQ